MAVNIQRFSEAKTKLAEIERLEAENEKHKNNRNRDAEQNNAKLIVSHAEFIIKKYNEEDIKTWMQNSLDQEAVLFAEVLGRYLKIEELTTSQIRNAFGELKRIEMTTQSSHRLATKSASNNPNPQLVTSLLMLKTKLIYSANRKETAGSKKFAKIIASAIDVVVDAVSDNNANAFDNLSQFFEAILAYHRAFGGK